MDLKTDFQQRFMKFETVRGIFLMPAGLFLAYTTWTHFQYSIQTFFTIIGLYWFIDGLRKIFVNRVKQKVEFKKEVAEHEAVSAIN